MRITFLLPAIGIAGGIRSTLELASRLHDRGHETAVVHPLLPERDGAGPYDIKDLVWRGLRALENIRRGNRVGWFDLRAKLIRVPTLAERWIPDADVVVATWWANAYRVHRYGASKGVKFYFIRHYETWAGPEDMVNRTYILPLHKIVTSSWLRNIVEEKFNSTVEAVLPNGVNFDLFHIQRDNFDCHTPKRVGLMYRRAKWKGMEHGLGAIYMAKQKFPDIKVVVFGEKPSPEDKKAMDRTGNVEFHLFPYKEKLRQIYNSLDIFVFPSLYEGFGNPPMEAMACGAACAATSAGAVPDYTVPGETALISQPGDTESLADNIIRLLENEYFRKTIAEQGCEHIKKFTWDSTAEKLEGVFSKYVERNT